LRSYLYILGALAVWSTWGLAVRWLGMSAAAIAFYNALFALFFQGIGLAAARRRHDIRLGRDLAASLLLGVFGLINVLSFFYALGKTTVAAALLTHYTAPVFVAALAPLMLRDRLSKATLIALGASAAGLSLIFMRGLGIDSAAGLAGAAAGTLSGVAYAFIIIFCRMLSGRNHPLKLAFIQCLIAVAVLGPYVIATGDYRINAGQALVLAAVGLLHSTLAIVLYLHGIRRVSAQEAGVLGYIEPVLGIMLAFVFLGERPHALALLGGTVIIASGIAVVGRGAAAAEGGEP